MWSLSSVIIKLSTENHPRVVAAQLGTEHIEMLFTPEMAFEGWRTSQPQTFPPQASSPDLSIPDFSTMNFSTMIFSTINFPTPDFSTADLGLKSPGLRSMGLKSPGLESSWLKNPGLKGPGLKLGVEKFGVDLIYPSTYLKQLKKSFIILKHMNLNWSDLASLTIFWPRKLPNMSKWYWLEKVRIDVFT